ncbi:MAG: conjugative transfer ATPase, partial [Gammaproteobacteria bacterium]|nr:conjugative transfer ATPase [Gammaproteobacteria bacterium]
YLQQLQEGLQGMFQDVFTPYFDDEAPWIVQFYLQDELSFKSFYETCENYAKPEALNTEYAKSYFAMLKEHCAFMTKPTGIFLDDKVSGNIYRGKIRKIRAVIYRRMHAKAKLRKGRTVTEDLNNIAQSFIGSLKGAGVKAKRLTGADFHNWMVRWFNPNPRGFASVDDLLTSCPYPGDENMPFGYDFSERFFHAIPKSDQEKGVWYFDEQPHKLITIAGLNSLPKIGHLSQERKFGNNYYALFDKFPEGSVFVLTVIITSQEHVKNHIFRIENSTRRSNSTNAEMAREDCAMAKREIESSNYLFPAVMGVYIRGNDLADLYQKETEVETLLSNNGMYVVDGDNDLTPVDSYLRFLPMCYSYQFDKNWMYRSRYLFGKQLAKLLPLYGRERGTGHPAIPMYNRCGEPFTLDPFNSDDKDNNSHLLLLGSTGAGKSATCVYLMMHLMATYRPRLVVIDAGNSFGLLSDYFKSQGLKVNRVEISLTNPPALNPFADSEKMLEQIAATDSYKERAVIESSENELEEEFAASKNDATEEDLHGDIENRDYLGEMALAAQLLITGGEKREQEKITRQDRMIIIDAIIRAAKAANQNKGKQMIISDLVIALRVIAEEIANQGSNAQKSGRVREMADSAEFFCKDHLSSLIFNRPGDIWPDADVTIFEMGIFKDEGYEAHRALAFMGAMNKSMSLAEQNQYDDRFTVFYGDEIHIITKNILTAVYLTKCSKMSRKIGLWLWLATQNVQDFPDDARKMLSMIEFWVCLGMSEAEMVEVERFKPLTNEERSLFRSVRKASGKYVEGVLLCNRFKGLFRNVPPRLALAIAMTEKPEKAERRDLVETYGCAEITAAHMVAARMMGKLAPKNVLKTSD